MSIESIGHRAHGPNGPRRKDESPRTEPVREVGRSAPVDRVEISGEGRAKAERAETERATAGDERFAEIQTRLDDGFYDRGPVLDVIAQRILRSGDL